MVADNVVCPRNDPKARWCLVRVLDPNDSSVLATERIVTSVVDSTDTEGRKQQDQDKHQQVHGWNSFYGEIFLHSIELLWAIFNEKRVTHHVVGQVVFQAQVIDPVDRNPAIPRMVHRDVALKGLTQVAYHVPMNGIAAQPKGLPGVSDFEI